MNKIEMETNVTETPLEGIADRITVEVAKICGCAWESCTRTRKATQAAILEGLRSERERAAKIAEAMRPLGGRMFTAEQDACYSALTDCAAAIREET